MIKKVLKLKEDIKEGKLREVKAIERQINDLWHQITEIERFLEEINEQAKSNFSYELVIRYKSLQSKRRELETKIEELEKERQTKLMEIKELYKEIKALNVIKERLDRENTIRSLNIESQRNDFLYFIRKKFFLLFFLLLGFSFAQSALQKKLKSEREHKAKQEVSEIAKDLEEKLKKIEEERKRLEELKKIEKPKEEKREELKKLVEIFNRTDPDEAGAIMNHMDPDLAAEVLANLKERQAASILQAMDPQKAAEVSKRIASKRVKK